MKVIYGVHSFNTYTFIFTKERLKEKHLFNFEYDVFLRLNIILDRENI